jgi:hypothetical protein
LVKRYRIAEALTFLNQTFNDVMKQTEARA